MLVCTYAAYVSASPLLELSSRALFFVHSYETIYQSIYTSIIHQWYAGIPVLRMRACQTLLSNLITTLLAIHTIALALHNLVALLFSPVHPDLTSDTTLQYMAQHYLLWALVI